MAIAPAVNTSGLTSAEILIIQSISAETYFVNNEVPTGTVNGSNTDFATANTPNPTDSLKVYVNAQRLRGTAPNADYSLSGSTITFLVAPPTNSRIVVDYINSPV